MSQISGQKPSWELLVCQTLQAISMGLTHKAMDLKAQPHHTYPMRFIEYQMMEMAMDLTMALRLIDQEDSLRGPKDENQVHIDIDNMFANALHQHHLSCPIPFQMRQPGLQDLLPLPIVLPQTHRPLISL